MQDKIKIACILLFIFTFWFQPSAPFLVKWLTQSKDFTAKQVYEDLFPLWSYAQFFLVIGGLFAQYVSFKAVFVFGAILSFASNAILMWGESMGWMRVSEVTNGAAVGTFGIFSAYIYTVFPQNFHQTITSYTRATTLVATTASASAGQLTVSLTSTVLVALCISLGVGVFNCVVSFFLPRPMTAQPSVVQIQNESPSTSSKCDASSNEPSYVVVTNDCVTDENRPALELKPVITTPPSPLTLRDQWRIMLANYNVPVLVWTTWSGLCIAIHMLVLTYWQSVMNQIDPSVNYNGYVSTVAYAFAAAVTLIPTKIEPLLNKKADYMLVVMPILYGTCLILLSRETVKIYLAYAWLILYHALFEFTLAVSSVQIARRTGKSKQFGVVFSLNMLIALLFQNLLQLLVGKQVFNLTPTQQYLTYGLTFLGISVLCLLWQLAVKLGARGKAGLEKYLLILLFAYYFF